MYRELLYNPLDDILRQSFNQLKICTPNVFPQTLRELLGVEITFVDTVFGGNTPNIHPQFEIEHYGLFDQPLPFRQADDTIYRHPFEEKVVTHIRGVRILGLFLLVANQPSMSCPDLPELRRRVGELDKQILKLVADRLETTKAIGEIKQKQGLPIRDFRVEVQVLKRARERAREVGLDENVAEELAELLMKTAVQTQAELPPVVHSAPRKWVHVVGGHGRMGTWLTRFFESQGHKVSVTDPNPGPFHEISIPLGESAGADVIVLASNLSSTPKLLDELLAHLNVDRSPLIFDIASLKAELVRPLREATAKGLRVTSLHPMFAPGTVLLSGRAVLVCDAGNRQATDEAKALFADTALGLYEVELEEHDRLMTVVLGMSHLINLIFGRAVSLSGFPFDLLGKVASTTFAKQIKTAAEVAEENPSLYHEIQYFNTHTDQMLEDLNSSLNEFCRAAQTAEGQGFHDLMKETAHYLRLEEDK